MKDLFVFSFYNRYYRNAMFLLLLLVVQVACSPKDPGPSAPSFAEALDKGTIKDDSVTEASGLAASRKSGKILWTHNDSGDKNRIFAITTDGAAAGSFYLIGATNRDWEDMAAGSGPVQGTSYLYVCDCGDNNAVEDIKTIYRFAEPDVATDPVAGGRTPQIINSIDAIRYRYPDGRRDAETMMVDPLTKDIYVVSKREDSVRVYVARYPQSLTQVITLEMAGKLPITYAVGGDISADGKEILVKSYGEMFYWRKQGNESITELLKKQPVKVTYKLEPQGEAVAWAADGSGYYTLGENYNNIKARLYFYQRR